MQASVWIRYLFGQAGAIRILAAERSTLWTGIALVFLTAIARNYDQTFIAEKPFLWLFGPLLFSIVSGSWLYVVVYGFARRGMDSECEKPGYWSGWRSFMGLFWMTAPIAWIYAIPVERFFDSLTAAKANVSLLAIVSLWRILLMARVVQVTTKAPYLMSLLRVLLAAAVEVVIVVFFGGGFARTIMASMGGMRNSPEEEILLSALSSAFGVACWTVPITLVLALLVRPTRELIPLPKLDSGRIAWLTLAGLATFWIAVAIVPQQELAKTVAVEMLIAKGKSREALDYFSRHQPDDFAPARTLPPKPYERSLFEELPDCFDAVLPTDAPWVKRHLVQRMEEMYSHYSGPRFGRRHVKTQYSDDKKIQFIADGVSYHGPDAEKLSKLLDGLQRIEEGQNWLNTNSLFLRGLREAAKDPRIFTREKSKSKAEQKADWNALSHRLMVLLPNDQTNQTNSLLEIPFR